MEQKRRTINTGPKRRSKGKLAFMIIGTIVGLALIFYIAYTISFKIFSPGVDEPEGTTSTQEDIANMSREDLEKNYTELQGKLEEKDEEIRMLENRLKEHESPASTTAPANTNTPPPSPPASTATVPPQTGTAPVVSPPAQSPPAQSPPPVSQVTPPPPTTAPDTLIDPDELGNLDID